MLNVMLRWEGGKPLPDPTPSQKSVQSPSLVCRTVTFPPLSVLFYLLLGIHYFSAQPHWNSNYRYFHTIEKHIPGTFSNDYVWRIRWCNV